MDYSLLVGIHQCSDSAQTTDEVLSDDRSMSDLPDSSAGVFAVKSSTGVCHFFILFVLRISVLQTLIVRLCLYAFTPLLSILGFISFLIITTRM